MASNWLAEHRSKLLPPLLRLPPLLLLCYLGGPATVATNDEPHYRTLTELCELEEVLELRARVADQVSTGRRCETEERSQ